ncbi:trypsin zeta-like [Teleopsis dalmanni]|uniref:trypsin zeta-like n=1 Tax=Teleopsis dalmanni TaxID=139649 RepID=UPI0018CEA6DB|nr:trypsin zeta-like [Teleopsis dalmanni]XP_037947698.1 trypsin zeta-like [Teleopsis dalmanni]
MKVLICLTALIALVSSAAIHYVNINEEETSLPRLVDGRIVGGKTVPIGAHPHQISLRYKSIFTPENAYRHRCGGSIYAENVVITAAHCIISTVPSQFQVVAGTNYRQGSDGAIVPVKEIIMHENYNPDTYDNDIAVLILGSPLPINNLTIKAIDLAVEDSIDGQNCVISGWGTTTEGGIAADSLQEVTVPIVSNEICNKDYEGLITDSMLCAGRRGVGGKDACQGDSGGPLLVNGKLAGVVSWGYGCARPEYPGVYAKVSYLHAWLLEKITPHLN